MKSPIILNQNSLSPDLDFNPVSPYAGNIVRVRRVQYGRQGSLALNLSLAPYINII
jgi:hypothetical protein